MEKKSLISVPVKPRKWSGIKKRYPLMLETDYPLSKGTELTEVLAQAFKVQISWAPYQGGSEGEWSNAIPGKKSGVFLPIQLKHQECVLAVKLTVDAEKCNEGRQQLKALKDMVGEQALITICQSKKDSADTSQPTVASFSCTELTTLIEQKVSASYFKPIVLGTKDIYLQGNLLDANSVSSALVVKPHENFSIEWHQEVRAYDEEDVKNYLISKDKDLSDYEIKLVGSDD